MINVSKTWWGEPRKIKLSAKLAKSKRVSSR